jgi:hypothetical protein
MTIPSWAVRGAKVVCVDDAEHNDWLSPGIMYFDGLDGLAKGQIYTVREVFFDEIERAWSVRLEEIVRGKFRGVEDGYNPCRFRPVVSQKDDLATHFEQYLKTDHRATERERA